MPVALSQIIDQIYLQRKNSTPVFSGEDVSQYYKLNLAHLWAVKTDYKILTLRQIPVAHMSDHNTLAILDLVNQIHPDLYISHKQGCQHIQMSFKFRFCGLHPRQTNVHLSEKTY